MIFEIMQLRQQGIDPVTAAQRLAQRYPQFRQALAMLQGKPAGEIDSTARNVAESTGIDPNQALTQLSESMRR